MIRRSESASPWTEVKDLKNELSYVSNRLVSRDEKQTYSCKDEEEIHKVYWKSMVTKKMTANPYVNDI